MPKVNQGETAYGIVQSLKTTPEKFLKANPSFAGKGGTNDYMGLTGNIQVGQEYAIPDSETETPITPTPGSGTYAEDIANTLDINKPVETTPSVAGTSDAERARIRKEEIEKIKTELGTAEKPAIYKSADDYKKLRDEQGIVNDEAELAAIRDESTLGKQDLRKFQATSGEAVPEAGRLGMMSEAERNLNFRLEGLAIRENTVLNRINSKNAYISNMVQLGQQDYTNALNDYNAEFTKNAKAIDLYNTQLDDQKKDALTGFTTLTNLLKDKNVDMANLSEGLKTQLQTLSLQAGLPEDTFELLMTARPDEKVLAPMTVDNAYGGKDIYFFTQDTDGNPHLVKTMSLGGASTGTGTGTTYTYTAGVNPVVDGYVQRIMAGTEKISSVPEKGGMRNMVSAALSQEASKKAVDSGIMDKLNDVNSLIDNKGIAGITGNIEQFKPSWLMNDEQKLAKSYLDKIVGSLKLDNRSLLKGTGTISDFEFKILGEAATALNRSLGEQDFKNELYRIKGAFQTASGLPANIRITAPDGTVKEGLADRAMIDDAIASGYKVDYIK
jgi:hypothetical protein